MLSHQRLLKCGVSHVQRINARIRKHGAERTGKGSSPRRQRLFRLNSHLFEFDSRPLVESVCAGGVEVLGEEGGEEAEIWWSAEGGFYCGFGRKPGRPRVESDRMPLAARNSAKITGGLTATTRLPFWEIDPTNKGSTKKIVIR
jgi:hypothetical protein